MNPKEGGPWLALGWDPLENCLTVAGFAETEEESRRRLKRLDMDEETADRDVVYRCPHRLANPASIHRWLRDCGVPGDEAIKLIRGLAAEVSRLLGSVEVADES